MLCGLLRFGLALVEHEDAPPDRLLVFRDELPDDVLAGDCGESS